MKLFPSEKEHVIVCNGWNGENNEHDGTKSKKHEAHPKIRFSRRQSFLKLVKKYFFLAGVVDSVLVDIFKVLRVFLEPIALERAGASCGSLP